MANTKPLSVPEAARKFGVKYTTVKGWIGFGYIEQTGTGAGSHLTPAELDKLELLAAFVEVGFHISFAAELLRPDTRTLYKLRRALEALERYRTPAGSPQPVVGVTGG